MADAAVDSGDSDDGEAPIFSAEDPAENIASRETNGEAHNKAE